MFDLGQKIYERMRRQEGALEFLWELLQEEFALLQAGQADEIASCEFSIQELLRQLAHEKEELRHFLEKYVPGSDGVRSALTCLPDSESKKVFPLTSSVRQKEQDCARQAAMNAELALALQEQSVQLLNFFRAQVMPKEENVYSANAKMYSQTQSPSLLSARY